LVYHFGMSKISGAAPENLVASPKVSLSARFAASTVPAPPRESDRMQRLPALLRYAGAGLFVFAAFGLTFALQRFFPYPFLFFFFGAVVVSAWFGGTRVGLFSVVLSILLVEYFFVPPYYSFAINSTEEAYFAAFVACALVASWVSSSKKRAEEALTEARDELEHRVSERTAALMRTQGELAHLSRMLSMAQLTASIVHEVGQPLTGVVTNGQACLEWLATDPPNLEKARRTTENIVRDGTRAGAVLSRIRALFKKEAPAKEWLNINEVVEEIATFLREEAGRRSVRIRMQLAPNLPKVNADRVQLQQVMLNLVVNAMDALSGVAATDREVIINSRAEDANYVTVMVEDSGEGLSSEDASRIFEPFFTTKAGGIGMGLSISRSIIESHSGRIWAAPGESRGAIVQFSIPIATRENNG
jgi:C4-dicarboxylate-specific signal transduction histidine kinase